MPQTHILTQNECGSQQGKSEVSGYFTNASPFDETEASSLPHTLFRMAKVKAMSKRQTGEYVADIIETSGDEPQCHCDSVLSSQRCMDIYE